MRLGRYSYEPIEIIEQQTRRNTMVPFALNGPPDLFSPGAGTRLREPSITAYHKDRALDEVFRRPFEGDLSLNKPPQEQRTETDGQSNVVDRWMSGLGEVGAASPPEEQPRSILERLERNRPPMRRAVTSYTKRKAWRSASQTGSAKSDPEEHDRFIRSVRGRPQPITEENEEAFVDSQITDRDADDELFTAADDESVAPSTVEPPLRVETEDLIDMHEEDVPTPTAEQKVPSSRPAPQSAKGSNKSPTNGQVSTDSMRERAHQRNSSTTTILFNPQSSHDGSSSVSPRRGKPRSSHGPNAATAARPRLEGRKDSSRNAANAPRRSANIPVPSSPRAGASRPGLPTRNTNGFKSTPNIARFLDLAAQGGRRDPSFNARALDLASDIGDNRGVVLENDDMPTLGSSFQEQLDRAASRRQQKRRSDEDSAQTQMSRLVLARMNTLEEGFKDMLREVRLLGSAVGSNTASSRGSATEPEISAGSASVARKALKRTPPTGERRGGGPAASRARIQIAQGVDVIDQAEGRKVSGLREVEMAENSPPTQRSVGPGGPAGSAQISHPKDKNEDSQGEKQENDRPAPKTSNSF